MEKIEDKIGVFIEVVFGLIFGLSGIGGILGGPAVIIYQCYLWLQKGNWESIHLIDVAEGYISTDILIWMQAPSSWVGASKIFQYLVYDAPLSGVLFLCGIGLIMIFGQILESKTSSSYTRQ